MLRALPAIAVALLLHLACAAKARAEEVFELENGVVLRGTVARETGTEVVIRLSGFPEDARVTVQAARIVARRAGTLGRPRLPEASTRPAFTDAPSAGDVPLPRFSGRPWSAAAPGLLPLEEPSVQREGFFERLPRVVAMAMPTDGPTRGLLAGLLYGTLLALVLLGGRLLEIEGLNLARAALLSAVLGGLLLADAVFRAALLRADRAPWVVPGQALAWLGVAWTTLRCGAGRAVLLLAFLLFSVGVAGFAAGAVLVAF